MKIATLLLLLVANSDALHLATGVRQRHALLSSTSVSMGLFDAIKTAFDDVQLERSASAVHVRPTHRRCRRCRRCRRLCCSHMHDRPRRSVVAQWALAWLHGATR